MARKWIKRATKKSKKGALRETVERRYGRGGFTEEGTIKVKVLRKIAKERHTKAGKRARLAMTFRRIRGE